MYIWVEEGEIEKTQFRCIFFKKRKECLSYMEDSCLRRDNGHYRRHVYGR